MKKTAPLISALVVAIILLGGVVWWQQGTHECEKRFGSLVEVRFVPIKGCFIKMGDTWRAEADIKNDVQQGVQQIQDGTKKLMQGIIGK